MNFVTRFVALAAFLCALALPASVSAHDVDGPDCNVTRVDFGDAPEGVLAYPGVIGKFPTCITAALPSTFDVPCAPISTPPGPSGVVRHALFGDNYWLGCYGLPATGLSGIDTDSDGKTNQPAVGISACNQAPTDCVEAAYGLTFDQDECFADGSDAGVRKPTFVVCTAGTITFDTASCSPAFKQVFLNVLVDWNHDGDWNDNALCGTSCAYEWAVKNMLMVVPPGCTTHTSPAFLVPPLPGPSWMRVSISDDPAPDDYPWNGTVSIGNFRNGETEDYPVLVEQQTPANTTSWGRIRSIYRG